MLSSLLVTAGATEAADKTHQQIMAEIRMLQEQQQQLAAMLGGLADTLKTVTARMDDQTNASRKAFADQKLLVDGIAEGVRILREKADDANVRLSSMSQELEAQRQIISSLPTSPRRPPVFLRPATQAPLPHRRPRSRRRRTSRRRRRTTRHSTTTLAASTISRSKASTST